MKKTIVFLPALFVAMFVFAQHIDQPFPLTPDQKAPVTMEQMRGYAEQGWFIPSWDLFDNLYGGDYSMVSHYANLVFPDSIVKYEGGNGVVSQNWLCAVGQVLDPYSQMFFHPLTAFQSYRVDSLFVMGWYNVIDPSVTDTLIAEFVIGTPMVSPQFAHTLYLFQPDTLHASPPRMLGSAAQKGYYAKLTASNKIIVKYPLTIQDTTMQSGKHIQFPVGIEVPMGKVIGVSLSFVPGYSYNSGDVLYSYKTGGALTQELNAFRMGLYSVNNTESDPSLFYDPYDGFNLSYYVHKTGRYGLYIDQWRNERMVSLITWGFEFGWKISGSDNISVAEHESTKISLYPNPANCEITIDCGVKGARLSIFSTQGQLIYSELCTENIHNIDVSQWARGMYYAEIISEGSKETLKFVLQ